MIFRCTARFVRSFDSLDAAAQALTLKALAGFRRVPGMPSHTAKLVNHVDPSTRNDDVWCIEVSELLRLTYSFLYDEHPDHHICVLRHIGSTQAR
jgi:hypothetical protein